jgi:hypothetical protein
MSGAAVEMLIAREEALIAALDGQNIAAIEGATRAMGDALAHVAAAGGWQTRPELGVRLVQALRLAEAARGRLNYLADRTRRQLDRLATMTGAPLPTTYRRAGRYS